METLYHDWLTPPKKLLFWGQRIQSFIVSLCVNVGRSMYTAGSQSGWRGGWLQEWSMYSPSGINRERLDKGPFTMGCRMHKQIINHVAWGCILENSTGWDRTQNPELSMTTDASSPLGGSFQIISSLISSYPASKVSCVLSNGILPSTYCGQPRARGNTCILRPLETHWLITHRSYTTVGTGGCCLGLWYRPGRQNVASQHEDYGGVLVSFVANLT